MGCNLGQFDGLTVTPYFANATALITENVDNLQGSGLADLLVGMCIVWAS